MMRILCEKQNTLEWKQARHSKITASVAQLALAKPGGKMRNLYVEKLTDDLEGVPDFDDEDDAPWFADGRYYESYARGWYSFKYDCDVRETGFVVHDDYSWIGCSPDGLVDPDGMVELKYRKFLHTFKQHAALRANASIIAQVQTQLFVTGRDWCDYVNYWRDDDNEVEQGACERIERDSAYIQNELLPAFVGLWNEVQALLKQRGVR